MKKTQIIFSNLSVFMLLGFLIFLVIPLANAQNRDAKRSVVGIKAQIPNSARTATLLGSEREGTGVVIDSQGLVVTIGYIILEAETLQILDINGDEIPATVVGYHAETGFGLVRSILDLKAVPIPLGNSEKLVAQDTVTILTHASAPKAHQAIIAARKTFTGYWEYLLENAIYTAPPISSFAGAALVNDQGALVGVGSLALGEVIRMNGQSMPGNLFVPIDQLKPIINDLEKNGRPSGPQRPWLGLFLTEQYGRVVVARVRPRGPAQKAGMVPGDIILEIDGHPVDGLETLYRTLWKMGFSGLEVPLTLLHQNGIEKIKIISGDRYNHYRYSHIY